MGAAAIYRWQVEHTRRLRGPSLSTAVSNRPLVHSWLEGRHHSCTGVLTGAPGTAQRGHCAEAASCKGVCALGHESWGLPRPLGRFYSIWAIYRIAGAHMLYPRSGSNPLKLGRNMADTQICDNPNCPSTVVKGQKCPNCGTQN